jgi:hypothetical protein
MRSKYFNNKSLFIFLFTLFAMGLGSKFIGLAPRGSLYRYGTITWTQLLESIPSLIVVSLIITLIFVWTTWSE